MPLLVLILLSLQSSGIAQFHRWPPEPLYPRFLPEHPIQDEPIYRGPPVYGPPVYGPPVYGPPVYGPPVYGPPVYGHPVYIPPVYRPPIQHRPIYPGVPDSYPAPPRPMIPRDVSSLIIKGRSSNLVEGDPISLTCEMSRNSNGQNGEVQFAFYKDGREVQGLGSSNKYEVPFAHLEHSGNYNCALRTSDNSVTKMSETIPVFITELFTSPDINVTRQPVVEGDDIVLSCDTSLNPNRQNTDLQFGFYRDGENVQGFRSSNKYEVLAIRLEDSGSYSCVVVASAKNVWNRSHNLPVLIQVLFTAPAINIIRYPEVEGDDIILTCDTSLNPLRHNTDLQFAFYKDGENVQGFISSNNYEVPSAHLKDSGSYYCEVKTMTNNVRKRSHDLPLRIQRRKKNYMWQNIIRLILSACLLMGLFTIIVYHVKSQD